jgi:PBP1b-binding outer membrane lipoprotein LpoB
MKRILMILALCAFMAGCATAPDQCNVKPSVVVQDHYVVSPIPAADLVIPPQVPDIDMTTATQKDVASWIVDTEGRSNDMEIKLRNIGKIQADQTAQAAKQNASAPVAASAPSGN